MNDDVLPNAKGELADLLVRQDTSTVPLPQKNPSWTIPCLRGDDYDVQCCFQAQATNESIRVFRIIMPSDDDINDVKRFLIERGSQPLVEPAIPYKSPNSDAVRTIEMYLKIQSSWNFFLQQKRWLHPLLLFCEDLDFQYCFIQTNASFFYSATKKDKRAPTRI